MTGALPGRWVVADQANGADLQFTARLRARGLGYVVAVACTQHVTTPIGAYRVDLLAASLPVTAWQRVSVGAGAMERRCEWSLTSLPAHVDESGGHHSLLVRRDRWTHELVFYRCWSPGAVALNVLVAVVGRRWRSDDTPRAAQPGSGSRGTRIAARPRPFRLRNLAGLISR